MSVSNELKIILERGSLKKLRLIPTYNGKKLSVFSEKLPHDLRDFLKRAYTYGMKEDQFIRFLTASNPDYPFVVTQGSQIKECFWKNSTEHSLVYQFKLSSSGVEIVVSSSQHGPVVKISDRLLMGVDSPVLLPAEESDLFFDDISDTLKSFQLLPSGSSLAQSTIFSLVDFQKSHLSLNVDAYNRVSLVEEDHVVYVNPSSPTVVVDVFETTSQDYLFTPLCVYGEYSTPLDIPLLKELMYCESLPKAFVTQDRKELVYTLFFDVFHKRITMNDVVVKLNESHAISSQENIERLKSYIEYLLEMAKSISYRFDINDGHWSVVEMNRSHHVVVIEGMIKAFQTHVTLSNDEVNFVVDKESFHEGVQVLMSFLNTHGIPLTLNKKKVDILHWDIEVVVDEEGSVPKILLDNKPINMQDLKQFMGMPWFSSEQDHVMLIDEGTRQKIQALLDINRLYESTKSKKEPLSSVGSRVSLIDWLFLEKTGIKVTIPMSIRRAFERLMSLTTIEKYPLSPSLKLKPRHYQEEGYSWLCFLYEHFLGGVLADDMGLGKTLQAIMLLVAVKEDQLARKNTKRSPHLIVVPPSLVYNWKFEIEKISSMFVINVYAGPLRELDKQADIIITTYDVVRLEMEKLSLLDIDIMIVDEAQLVKNQGAARTVAIQKMKAGFVICLTGTPLENHLGEYFTILNLALPGIFMAKEFDEEHYSLLLKRAAPFVLRRLKGSVFKELPPKQEIDVFLEFSDEHKSFYNSLLLEIRAKVQETFAKGASFQANAIALTSLLRLRQACISPALLGIESSELPPKFKYFLQQVTELQDEGHSSLIFSQFTSSLDLIEPLLKEKNISYLRLDGKTSVVKRKALVDQFQNSEKPLVFLMSLKAGGVGLNLTRASYVFHLDPWWNPAAERQASDRAHRIGQTQTVMIMHLIMKDTIEEKIMLLKQKKMDLFNEVFSLQEAHSGKLSREDFEFLLS